MDQKNALIEAISNMLNSKNSGDDAMPVGKGKPAAMEIEIGPDTDDTAMGDDVQKPEGDADHAVQVTDLLQQKYPQIYQKLCQMIDQSGAGQSGGAAY